MTFQFAHKNYTTSPTSFQAQEYTSPAMLESDEGKMLVPFPTLIYPSCLQIHQFVKNLHLLLPKGLKPPADVCVEMPLESPWEGAGRT